jgi:predicted CXXCH cytochrome family protein
MRLTTIISAAFLAVFMIAATATAQVATGGLDGTDHDLRIRLGIDQVCLPCHAPHNGPGAAMGPIWNHMLTTQSFVRNGASITLAHSSKLCMSCHDGQTAVGNYGTITTATDVITSSAALGTDLLEDDTVQCGSCHYAHGSPVGFDFLRVGLVDSELCRICHTF